MHTPRTRERHKSHEAKGDSSHSGTRNLLVFIKSNNRLFAFMDYTRHHWRRYEKQTRKQNFNSLIFKLIMCNFISIKNETSYYSEEKRGMILLFSIPSLPF